VQIPRPVLRVKGYVETACRGGDRATWDFMTSHGFTDGGQPLDVHLDGWDSEYIRIRSKELAVIERESNQEGHGT
jgi:hypothetical protein